MSTQVVFLSRHEVNPTMISQLEEKLGEIELVQFKGSYANFKATAEGVQLDHSLQVNGEMQNMIGLIPAGAVVIAILPLPLQMQLHPMLVKQGSILLIPYFNREAKEDGTFTISNFVGLKKVEKIEVITEQWSGREAVTRPA